jgi:hypothetical protein
MNHAATTVTGQATRFDMGPSREATSGPKGGADQRSGPPPVKATASRPMSNRTLAGAGPQTRNLSTRAVKTGKRK